MEAIQPNPETLQRLICLAEQLWTDSNATLAREFRIIAVKHRLRRPDLHKLGGDLLAGAQDIQLQYW